MSSRSVIASPPGIKICPAICKKAEAHQNKAPSHGDGVLKDSVLILENSLEVVAPRLFLSPELFLVGLLPELLGRRRLRPAGSGRDRFALAAWLLLLFNEHPGGVFSLCGAG